jgi:hypothetical protein
MSRKHFMPLPDLIWVENWDPLPSGTWQMRKVQNRFPYVRLDLSDEEIQRIRAAVKMGPEVKE